MTPTPGDAKPSNLSMFSVDGTGTLIVTGRARALAKKIDRVSVVHTGQVYMVANEGFAYDVQISPRLLCACHDSDTENGICGHIATVLALADSPLLAQSDRLECVARPAGILKVQGSHSPRAPGNRLVESSHLVDRLLSPESPPEDWRHAARQAITNQVARRAISLIPEAYHDPFIAAWLVVNGKVQQNTVRGPRHIRVEQFSDVYRELSARDPIYAAHMLWMPPWSEHTRTLRATDLLVILRSGNASAAHLAREALPRMSALRPTHEGHTQASPRP